jgi:hypothetical protein
MKPIISIFTSPKPFTNPHIAIIQRNAIQSWVELGDEVQVILFGDEAGVAETARELGVMHSANVKLNSSGTPLLSDQFAKARAVNDSPMLAFINADILLFPDFLDSAKKIHLQTPRFLIVGQRWDLDVPVPIDFSQSWQERVAAICDQAGKLHKPAGSDYFIFPRECFTNIPDFAIGRAGWDNWMFYETRQQGWKLIDATHSIRIIHQSHDYAHLPGGQPHYHLPETYENVRLGGGKRHIFTLHDVNWQFIDGKLTRPKLDWKRFWREIEIFPLVHLHSQRLAGFFFALFHPRKAYNEFRKKLNESTSQE